MLSHQLNSAQKHIDITFASDGTVEVEAIGFKGQGCEQATKQVEEALGIVANRKKKPDFYQPAKSSTGNNQSVGS